MSYIRDQANKITRLLWRSGRNELEGQGSRVRHMGVAETGTTAPAPTAEGMLWLDTGSGTAVRTASYAGISVDDNAVATTISVAGTKVQVTVFDTNSPSQNLTPDHTNDHITIDAAGDYYIAATATVNSGAGAGSRFQMTVEKNNGATVIPGLHVDRNIGGGGGSSGSVTMSGSATLAASDTIEVWIENETNTVDYTIENVNLFIMKVSA